MNKTVWVLTYELVDFDQESDYFLAVFSPKPTLETLAPFINDLPNHMGRAIAKLQHILNGGGRMEYEHKWYFLREVELNTRIEKPA